MNVEALEHVPAQRFQAELARSLIPLRKGLGELLHEVGSPRTPTELQKKLGIPYTACWQIFRILSSADVTAEAQHAPSPGRLKTVLAAGVKAGVSQQTLDTIAKAADNFRRFVKTNADDRASFDAMVTAVSSEESAEGTMLRDRQIVYRGLCRVWGAQIDVLGTIVLLRMSDSGNGDTDECTIPFRIGVRRLRPDALLRIFGYHSHPENDAATFNTALDPEAARIYGAPILPQFSSQPFPKMAITNSASGWNYYHFAGDQVGLHGSANFAFGVRIKDRKPAVDLDGKKLVIEPTFLRNPVGLFISDFLVHRPTMGRMTPEASVHHATSNDVSLAAIREMVRLPIQEKVQFMGPADQLSAAPEIPNHLAMLRYACETTGWTLSEFDVYRVRIPYPIMHTMVAVQFALPSGT